MARKQLSNTNLSTVEASAPPVAIKPRGTDAASSAAAYQCGFYFEYEVLAQFPEISRKNDIQVIGNFKPVGQQILAYQNFNNRAMLARVSSGYRIAIIELRDSIKARAKEVCDYWVKECLKIMGNNNRRTVTVTNTAQLKAQVLGDLQIMIEGHPPISLELKWQESSKGTRYFGPLSDQTLFGDNNYFNWLQLSQYWSHDRPAAQWVKLIRTTALYEFLQTRFSTDMAFVHYILQKGIGGDNKMIVAKTDYVAHGSKVSMTITDYADLAAQLGDYSASNAATTHSLKNAIIFQKMGEETASFNLTKYKLPPGYTPGVTSGVSNISYGLYIQQKFLSRGI